MTAVRAIREAGHVSQGDLKPPAPDFATRYGAIVHTLVLCFLAALGLTAALGLGIVVAAGSARPARPLERPGAASPPQRVNADEPYAPTIGRDPSLPCR